MKKISVKKAYKIWSKNYDMVCNTAILCEGNKPINSLGKLKGKKILDLGCGTGRNSIKIARKGAKVIGIDFSKDMLKIAKNKAEKLNLDIKFDEQNFLKKIKFKSKTFDGIICNLVFGHIKNTLPIIKEMKRVLKNNGIIVITDIHPFAWFLPLGKEYHNFFIPPKLKIKSHGYKHYVFEMYKQFMKTELNLLDIEEFIVNKKLETIFKKQGFLDKTGQAVGIMYVLKKK
tara:strand:- start:3532 stop:4221 length:690 start_codon:yes stop_codon:yes gene_type:complete